MPKQRIGIMGGSFNPIHERHLELAICAMKEQKLDRVIFLPTGNPPHKREGLEDAEHRFEMTRLCMIGLPKCSASRMEIDREGVIYTVDTLTRMLKDSPDLDLYYIIGEDTLLDLPNWRKPDKVFTLCKFLVCRRSEDGELDRENLSLLEQRGARLTFLQMKPMDISATEIRAQLASGIEPTALRPQVLEYIRMMGLYGRKTGLEHADVIYGKLKQSLSDRRLLHSVLVAATARKLAAIHGVNENQAVLAALLHDCAKCMPLSEMQKIAKEHRLLVDKETMQSTNLLHGPVGAVIAQRDYGIEDQNILAAIRCHTVGKVGMLPLDMIVYLSDKIEPSRRSYPALEEVRRLSSISLIDAIRYSMESTLEYIAAQKSTIHPDTMRTAQWLGRMAAKKNAVQQNKRSEMNERTN